MGKRIDLLGQRFGRLTVINETSMRANGSILWECRCDCGNTVLVRSSHLRRGGVLSCGCYNQEIITTHGDKDNPLYHTYQCMKNRCNSPSNPQYKDYGGRGIKVCEEWANSYEAFKEWSLANGYKPNCKRGECTIDRIDNDGDYSPENCRWVDMKVQGRNRRNNHLLTINGETHCIVEWAEIAGIVPGRISTRLRRGWSAYDAVFRPIG